MRWPFKYKPDRAAADKAKRQLEVAKALQESAQELAAEHRAIVAANHFAQTIDRALGGR